MKAGIGVEDFRLVQSLYLDLAEDIHPDRWRAVGLTAEAVKKLTGCVRSRRTLSRRLEWLTPGAVGSLDEWAGAALAETGRWTLMRGADLWRLALRFGAGCLRAEVAKLVLRGEVAAFKAEVGADAHAFALRQAPLLWRGDAPLDGIPAGGPVARRALAAAGLGLGCRLADLPPALAARAALKLPPSCDAAMAEAAVWEPERRRVWLALLKRVFAIPA